MLAPVLSHNKIHIICTLMSKFASRLFVYFIKCMTDFFKTQRSDSLDWFSAWFSELVSG